MERRRILVVAAALVAALGAVLVLLYVHGADSRAQAQFATRQVLTATQAIAQGESFDDAVKAGKIDTRSVVTADVVPGALGQEGVSSLTGTSALAPIYPGQQILAAEFGDKAGAATTTSLPIPAKHVAISVTLTDPARVAGYVEPGSRVAVFLNGSDAGGAAFTRLLLPDVTVLGVGSTPAAGTTTSTGSSTDSATGGSAAPTETLPNTLITLAVTQKQAQKVLFAQQNGALSFALLGSKSGVKAGPRTDLGNLFE
ncbi:Flp pilus assembly protein CpaB [Nocardioides sp. DS6]|uniref:Flp pilus assembly protein CpaB n=1 Tax=Nocardioides eburneus TaxID=3231482 RepID=A0ABV3SWW8_9ACTN